MNRIKDGIGIYFHETFFSIITPVKNGEMFVTNYINCLLKQTFDDWEAIIVDDNSNDKTYEKLLINIGGDKRFRIRKLSKTKKNCEMALSCKK